ncbi:hypothetical protein O181_041400 [Austropuccinia psidii MF-1]|uniref:Uncharacterized protein n=1 Tax=Austropuccinia psidii MF-1 TaxID=1389203 RepID=A0A9Q3HH41_9BASI|nr:hypothetical protein [Austropuccinia psidii MF-1]
MHTRNGSNYSVQQDGCGQGRGKTKSRSPKSSSRKTHMEDAIVSPHSPRSAPTNFDVKSESELINDNNSMVEPFLSGRNRNLSIPIQELVQSSQRGGVGNMPKPLAGGHELLLTHQELSESREHHRALRRPEEEVGNDPRFGDRRPSGIYQLQTSSRSVQGQAQKTSEDTERYQEPSGKGKGKENWHRPYPQGYRNLKLEPSAVDSVFNMARTLMEFTAKEQESMKRNFPCK